MSKATTPAQRLPFRTSRLLEYLSEAELQKQIGFARGLWPAGLVKEPVDNSLDACEAAGVLPEIDVVAGQDCFAVADNGPGIPPDMVAAALDFASRTSTNSQ